ncbi:MAG: glmU [Gammaproteobacteria bacterium]|nr:glmU [Gammaproteobacteria bacterium]
MAFHIIILAAGQGTRMRSDKPKVLHPVAGKPILAHILNTVNGLKPKLIHVVYGYGGEQLQKAFENYPVPIHWVNQPKQQGTGDAVKHVLPFLNEKDTVLILLGDMPLISERCLQDLVKILDKKDQMGVLTACVEDPDGLGRIIRDEDGKKVIAIQEQKDIKEDRIHQINEINTGVFALPVSLLQRYLPRITNRNAQGEYYLVDLVELLHREGITIIPIVCKESWQALGINNKAQLSKVERQYQRLQVAKLMEQGVTVIDPERVDIRGELRVGKEVTIDVNTIFEGEVSLGEGTYIGANTIIKDSTIGKGVRIASHSVVEGATIGDNSAVGPFARIRPGTILAEEVHIGNFVELKKAKLGKNTKAGHLTYLGDAIVGSYTNIGAGTITCNYDGCNKYETRIGDHVFIGSNTLLRAPVNIGDHATTGAGAVIRHDVDKNQLSITWQKQLFNNENESFKTLIKNIDIFLDEKLDKNKK